MLSVFTITLARSVQYIHLVIHAKCSCLKKETIYRYNHGLDIFRPYFFYRVFTVTLLLRTDTYIIALKLAN